MKRLKVGVVFGGRSVEHDVSIVTAHQVMEALEARHEVVPIYITREGYWLTSPKLNDLEIYRQRRWAEVGAEAHFVAEPGGGLVLRGVSKRIRVTTIPGLGVRTQRRIDLDVVVPAVHGTFGEDGTLQGLLELADLPYTGSGVVGSAVGMDKTAMKAAFTAAGLPVVPDALVEVERLLADPEAVLDSVERQIGYPCFVKPVKAGSSVGIAKGTDRASLRAGLEIARRYDRRILVEQAMEGCVEINCSVLGGGGREPRVSVCEQPVAWQEFLSFEDKYMGGGKQGGAKSRQGMASLERQIPAPIPEALTKQVQENALLAFRSIDAAGVARIDSFVNESTGETWLMEINTTPGSFAFYLWEPSGLVFEALMDELIEIALQRHRAKQDLMFTFDSSLLQREPGGKSGG